MDYLIFSKKGGECMQIEKTRNPKKIWIVLGVIISILLIVGINITVTQNKSKVSTEDLKYAKVTMKEISNTKLVSGRVVPGNEETFYIDSTKGKVNEIFVQEGQTIEPGQKLYSYDNPELGIQLKQFDIDKKMTNIRYDQEKSQIASLKKEIQTNKNMGAGKELITPLENQLQDAEFQLKTTELELEKNKLQEQDLQLKQNELVVTSRIKGIVKKVDKDVSQSSPSLTGAQGSPFIQIASQDPYQVHGTLSELQMSQIQPEQSITITSKAIPDKSWNGKIVTVSQYPSNNGGGQLTADVAGQSQQSISYYDFKASLDTQDGLAPGYHVTIQVKLDSKKILAVPRSSIVEKEDTSYIFVVNGNKIKKQEITTGISDGEWIEVLEGLKVGKKIVKNPSSDLKDGMEVKGK
jgi:HlyD family secretion protein